MARATQRLGRQLDRLLAPSEVAEPPSATNSSQQGTPDYSDSATDERWYYAEDSQVEILTAEVVRESGSVSVAYSYYGRCVHLEEAPPYLRRRYIHTGYYIGGTHSASALSTLFSWNNETLNAWTIIMGVWVTIAGILYTRWYMPEVVVPVVVMVLSAFPHAPWAIALHCTIGVSESTRDFLRTMDVFFIITCSGVQLTGSYVVVPRGLALAWFVFPTAAAFRAYSAALLAAWVYSVASICVLRRVKDLPKAVLARDVAFIVLCYVSPCAVGAAKELLSVGPGLCTLYCGAMLGALWVAAFSYAHHLPERWAPGRFDHVGNSHQIMHVLVVVGYALEWLFLIHLASLSHAAVAQFTA